MDSSEDENALLEMEAEETKTSVKSEHPEKSKPSQSISSSTRQMRNLAEKMRRDKLNTHISDLASIVPMVATATKRVDKTSVLRLSAAYLRIHQNLISGADEKYIWQPCFLNDINLSGLLLEAVNGFLLVVTLSGKIIYVSEGIDKLLGHSPVDILGHSLYTIIHPDDCPVVQKQLQSEYPSQRRSFCCHMAERSLSRNDCGRYSLVHIIGHVRTADQASLHPSEDEYEMGIPENLLIAIVKVIRNQPIAEISWMDGCHDEYVTQHSMDGRIMCADHRISIVAGYLPHEVIGRSAYEFMYPKDRLLSVFAHRLFLTDLQEKDEATGGIAVYRLCTGANTLIYLKSQGVFQFNSEGKPESFILINRLLSDREGRYEIQRMFLRYTPSVKESGNSAVEPSSKSLKWGSSSSCSDDSEVPEIPSTLEEEQWRSLSVPFPLSFLPSTKNEKKAYQAVSQSMWEDSNPSPSKAHWQEIMSNEADYNENTTSTSKRDDCSTASYKCKQSSTSPQYLRPDFPDEPHFYNVSSTTSDNDLMLTTDALSTSNKEFSVSAKLCVANKSLPAVVTRRASKRQAQENGNECFSSKDYGSTSKSSNNGSSQSFLAQTPTKKRCSRVEQSSAKSVYNISKTSRNHPR